MQCTRQLEYVQRRAKELRQDCSEYFAEAHPSLQGIKDPIEATLAAAQLLLQSPDTTEEFQLRFAQRMLEMAEFWLADAERTIDTYGGPKRARLVGGR